MGTYLDSEIGVKGVDDLAVLADFADEAFLTAEGALLDVFDGKDNDLLQDREESACLDLAEVLQRGKDIISI